MTHSGFVLRLKKEAQKTNNPKTELTVKKIRKEINCKIKHGKLIITFYEGNYKIKRLKKGTKTIISEFVILTPEEFERIFEGQIFKYRHVKVAKYSELIIVRKYSREQRIIIYNEEIEEIKNSISTKQL